MPYSTQSDIEKKLPGPDLIELTDDTSAGVVNTGNLDAAIAEADELIDSYAGRVRKVPFSPVPGLIKSLSVTISIWLLHERRGFENEVRRRAHEDAIGTLKLLADGKITLGDDVTEADSGANEVEILSDTRKFDDDSMEGF